MCKPLARQASERFLKRNLSRPFEHRRSTVFAHHFVLEGAIHMNGLVRAVAVALTTAMLAACSMNGASVPAPAQPAPAQPGVTQTHSGVASNPHVMRTRFAPKPPAGSNLLYGGGPIEKFPKSFVVYWHFTSDPSGEATYFNNYLGGVGASSWLNSVTQYYESSRGNITNPSGQLHGTWFDSASIPRHPTDSQIQAEARKAVAHFGYDRDAMYFVATQHGHNTSGFGTQYCAYHGATSTSSGTAAYTNMPYITDAGASCGQNAVNGGSAGLLDGVSIVGGHELAEGETDPIPPSGWTDSGGAENGDKCAWVGLANITLSTGTFAVQPLWSNASSSCVLSYP
jgi:serine protease